MTEKSLYLKARHFLSRYYYQLKDDVWPLLKEDASRYAARAKVRSMAEYQLPTVSLSEIIGNAPVQLENRIDDSICLPPYQKLKAAFNDHDDFTALMSIAKVKQPKIVVELGTAHGNTVANICRYCPETTVYTVNAPFDVQSGDIITYKLEKDTIGSVYRKYGYESRVVQIYKNTLDLDLSEFLKGAKIDLAIVDACHDADYVVNDFLKVFPHMNSDGVVVLHDTHPKMTDHLFGSYLGCVMLRKQGYDVRHLKDTWWGIWRSNWSDKG